MNWEAIGAIAPVAGRFLPVGGLVVRNVDIGGVENAA